MAGSRPPWLRGHPVVAMGYRTNAPAAEFTAVSSKLRQRRESGVRMAQTRVTQQPVPDEDIPPLPSERRLPPLPSDTIPEPEDHELPTLPTDDVPQLPDQDESEFADGGGAGAGNA